MLQYLCICSEVPLLRPLTRLCLVLHRDEARKPTNTGKLAARCLSGSEVLVHGRKGEKAQCPWLPEKHGRINVLLFPSEEATSLSAEHLQAVPIRLVVPDGTWRQASKMVRRIPWLQSLPRVGLPPDGGETQYRLRSEPKAGGLATMEAIARAYGVLEGSEIQKQLESIFRIMIDRTLFSRGLLARDEVFGGLPESARRHMPGEAN